MKKSILLCIAVLSFFIVQAQNHFSITGQVKGFSNNAKVYLNLNDLDIDSATILNGYFKVKGTNYEKGPESVFLQIIDNDQLFYRFIFIENDSIILKGSKEGFNLNSVVIGGKNTSLFEQYEKKLRPLFEERNKITKDYLEWSKLPNSEVDKKMAKIKSIDQERLKIDLQTLNKGINTYLGIYVLYSRMFELNKKQVETYYNKIPKQLVGYSYAKKINSFLHIKPIKIGNLFRDFNGKDKEEIEHKFSAYFIGEFILLEFTSAYCGPCRIAIPEIEKLNATTNGKLKTVSFITDINPKWISVWESLHKSNSIALWDKTGISGPTPSNYSVNATPTYFLFNPKGNLIYTNAGFKEELVEKINLALSKDKQSDN